MSFSIAGKTAIVTGSSTGIGLAIGRQFVAAGANVMFADTNEAALVRELGEQADESNIRYFAGDLRERLTIANLLSATIDAFEDIDILVNGARQVVQSDPLDPNDESLEMLLTENLLPTLRLSQQVARRMIKQGEGGEPDTPLGAIVNLSSIAARRTHPELMA
jgi:7-alpha-hydroxysteroid dehydrogenase